MAILAGFWSYVHADDEAEGGRIVGLGRQVATEYALLTSDSIDLFIDRDALEWGAEWKQRVDGSLGTVGFFCPLITPRFFTSAECRRELRTFATKAESVGLGHLLLPILYVDVPQLHEDDPSDEMVALVKRYQWTDWTSLRFEDVTSGAFRKGVSDLAKRLVDANRDAEAVGSVAPVPELGSEEEPAGVLDLIAEMEQTFPVWNKNIEALGGEIVVLGERTRAAAGRMTEADAAGKGFAGRILVAKELASELAPHAADVERLGNQFAEHLATVDAGVRSMLELAEANGTDDPEEFEAAREFFRTIVRLAESSREGLGSVRAMLDSMRPVEKLSRDLRPVLRQYRTGLTAMTEGVEISDSWVEAIRQTRFGS